MACSSTCTNLKVRERDYGKILGNKNGTSPDHETRPQHANGMVESYGKRPEIIILNTDELDKREDAGKFHNIELITEHLREGEMIDLAFLTNHERRFIQKVIQEDLKFRRVILGSLKRSIDEAQQSHTEETPEQSKPGSCTVCGLQITTICSRVFAVKCSDCGRITCQKCAGKQVHGICLHCNKNRTLRLKMLDYESILHYGFHGQTEPSSIPTCAESELIKKSLCASSSSLKMMSRQSVSRESLNQPSTASTPRGGSEVFKASPEHTQYSSRVSHISDPACGYQLVAQGVSEEGLVDTSSVYSEQCYSGDNISGHLYLALWYKSDEKRLYVHVDKAEDLAVAVDGTLDPYVKTYLLPGVYKSNKRKTGIQNNTSKPVWDEIIKYGDLTQEEVGTKTLWVSVWDWNKYGRQQFLGEIHIPLSKRDLTNSKNEQFQLLDSSNKSKLSIESEEHDSPEQQTKPRVLIGLKFDPYTRKELARLRSDKNGKIGCLRIKLQRAENLPAMDVLDRTDSFARCYLLPNRQLGGKKKSKIVEDSLNPIWEEEVIYTFVSLEELQAERALEVTLWDFDRRGTNQFIGGVKIGPNPSDIVNVFDWMDSMESESDHWEDMIDRPGEWTEAWHTLRPSMDSLRKNIEADRAINAFPNETPENISTHNIPNKPTAQTLRVSSRQGKGLYKINGEVLIGIKFKDGFLQVKIIQATGLTAVHKNKTSSPYIKTYLLPDKSKESKKKTVVKKKTLNPTYNQTLKYRVSEENVKTRTLWVSVWSNESIGANLFMGETCISLAGNLRHSVERWYELHDFSECEMIVMATPFGHTPQRYLEPQSAVDVRLFDHSEGAPVEDIPLTPPLLAFP